MIASLLAANTTPTILGLFKCNILDFFAVAKLSNALKEHTSIQAIIDAVNDNTIQTNLSKNGLYSEAASVAPTVLMGNSSLQSLI